MSLPNSMRVSPSALASPVHQIGIGPSRVAVVEQAQVELERQTRHPSECHLVRHAEAGRGQPPVVEGAVQRREVEVARDAEAIRRHPVLRMGVGVGQAHLASIVEALLHLPAGAERLVSARIPHLRNGVELGVQPVGRGVAGLGVDRAVEEPSALAGRRLRGWREIDLGDVELINAEDVEEVHGAHHVPGQSHVAAQRHPQILRKTKGRVERVHFENERPARQAFRRLLCRIYREGWHVRTPAIDAAPVQSRGLEGVAEIQVHRPPGKEAYAAPEKGRSSPPDVIVPSQPGRPHHVAAGCHRGVDAQRRREQGGILRWCSGQKRHVEPEAGSEGQARDGCPLILQVEAKLMHVEVAHGAFRPGRLCEVVDECVWQPRFQRVETGEAPASCRDPDPPGAV